MSHLRSLFTRTRSFSSTPLVRTVTVTTQTLLWAHVLANYGFTLHATHGPSMLPTCAVVGDWFLAVQSHRRGRDIQVGDIVTMASVVDPQELVIKRVLACQGDYISRDAPSEEGSVDPMMLQVPTGHCWVEGDNLPDSRDSRTYGPVPMALIKGKIVAKISPWEERQWLENPVKAPASQVTKISTT